MAQTRHPIQLLAVRKVPPALAVVIVSGTVALAARITTDHWRSYEQRMSCRGRQHAIVEAERAYARTYHRLVTGSQAALTPLVGTGGLAAIPTCPQGGHYTIVQQADRLVIVKYSLPEHGPGIGYRPEIPSPESRS